MPVAVSLPSACAEMSLQPARQETTLDGAPAKRDRKQKKDKKDKKDKKEKKKKGGERDTKRSLRGASSSEDEAALPPAGSAAATSSAAKQPRREAPALWVTEPSSAAAEVSSAGQPPAGAPLEPASEPPPAAAEGRQAAGLAPEAVQLAEAPHVAGTAATLSVGSIDAAQAVPPSGENRKRVLPGLKSLGRHSVAEVQRDLWKIMHDSETELELASHAPKKHKVEAVPEIAEDGAAERADRELDQQGEHAAASLHEALAPPPQRVEAAVEEVTAAPTRPDASAAPLHEAPPPQRVEAPVVDEAEDHPVRRAAEDAQASRPTEGGAVQPLQADDETEPTFLRDASVASSFPDTLPDDNEEGATLADTQLDAEDTSHSDVDAVADVSAALREQPPDEEVPEEQGEKGIDGASLSEEEEVVLAAPPPVDGLHSQAVGLDNVFPGPRPQPREASTAEPAGVGNAEGGMAQVAVHQAFHKVFLLGEQAAAGQCATLEAAFSACTTADAQIQRFHQETKEFQLRQAQEFTTAMMEEDRCRRVQLEAETALSDKERLRAEAVAAEHASWADTREAHTREIEEFLAAKRAQTQELERQRETRRQEAEAAWGTEKGAALAKIKAAVGATQQARAEIQKTLVFCSQNSERWKAPAPSVAGVTALIAEAAGGHAAEEALAVAQERVKELRRLGQAAFRA